MTRTRTRQTRTRDETPDTCPDCGGPIDARPFATEDDPDYGPGQCDDCGALWLREGGELVPVALSGGE